MLVDVSLYDDHNDSMDADINAGTVDCSIAYCEYAQM